MTLILMGVADGRVLKVKFVSGDRKTEPQLVGSLIDRLHVSRGAKLEADGNSAVVVAESVIIAGGTLRAEGAATR